MTIRFSIVDSAYESTGLEHNRACRTFHSLQTQRQEHVQESVRRIFFLASFDFKCCAKF